VAKYLCTRIRRYIHKNTKHKNTKKKKKGKKGVGGNRRRWKPGGGQGEKGGKGSGG